MSNIAPIRLFVVDDCDIIREGFRQILQIREHYVVVGTANSGEEALKKIPDTEVDLALVDITMVGMNGIELTRRLSERSEALPVLIISIHRESRYVEEALQAGAGGYVLMDNVHKLLFEAAREVTQGNLYLDQDLEERINVQTT